MRAALATEYRKIVTTRLWWILLLAMAGYMAVIAAGMAWGFTQPGAPGSAGPGETPVLSADTVVRNVYTIAVTFGYAFPVIVGALSVTTEFRHQTITPTLLAEPRRGVVLVSKLLAGAVVGAVFGVVGTLATVAAGAGVLTALGEPTFLGEAGTWRTLALSALALALWCVVGVSLGTVLTNQVASIVVLIAFNQLVEPLLRFALALTSWGQDVAAFLPGAAGEAISGGSFWSASGLSTLLPWWQGLLVLTGYVVVLAGLGRVTTLRRDIT